MKSGSEQKEKILKYGLGGILLVVLLFFIVGEWLTPSDVPTRKGSRNWP